MSLLMTYSIVKVAILQQQGLKIHNTKTHQKIDFEAVQANGDIFERVLEN